MKGFSLQLKMYIMYRVWVFKSGQLRIHWRDILGMGGYKTAGKQHCSQERSEEHGS
jgi:hypothetical protein